MSLTIDLPSDLETRLTAEAERLQLSLPEYALRLLRDGGRDVTLPRTGSDLVAYWQKEGLIGTRPDIADASEHSRRIRDEAERRKRA
jgi:hypothetical protein